MGKSKDVLEIVLPVGSDDEISEALRRLTRALDFVGAADGQAGGLFGGGFGYGADYEGDVFLMHRYCWCEEESCLWCGASTCRIDRPEPVHAERCYFHRLQALRRKYGSRPRGGGDDYWSVPFGDRRYEGARDALCDEFGVSRTHGCECHCTCGAEAEWKREYAACDCDWHQGRGIYRFGKAVSAPHFWHKPTGAQVRWYKYIGRGMELTAPTVGTWADVFTSCQAALAQPAAINAVDPSASDPGTPTTREKASS